MKYLMIKSALFAFFVLTILNISAQSNFSNKILFLGANLFDDVNKDLYSSKLTKDGFFTLEPGLNLAVEVFGSETMAIKLSQTLFFDQTKSPAGSTQILLRFKAYSERKNSIYIGLGPILFFRSSWADFQGYVVDDLYNQTGNLQYSFFWLSAELEYNKIINKKFDFTVSLNHFHRNSVTFMTGFKYWFSRKSNHCNTCPSYR